MKNWIWIAIGVGVVCYWLKNGDCVMCGGKSPNAAGKDRDQAGNALAVYL